MSSLEDDIRAFEGMRDELEASHMGEWALVHDQKLINTFETFNEAAQEAARKFGKGPYLIRQVGVESPTLPASVLYHPIDA